VPKYMGPRGGHRMPSPEDILCRREPPPLWGLLPGDVRACIDVTDPDLDFLVDEVTTMRLSGFDMTDPENIDIAVQVARLKAAKFRTDAASGKFQPMRPPDDDLITLPGYCAPPTVVYYMRLGNRCKIGYTNDLKRRMSNIQPEELLATEPGGEITETERHIQFAHLRVIGEWFRYEDALVEHVNRLRAA